jgi:hypothetical protein
MKFLLLIILASLSFSTFAQDRCEMRVERLRERLAEVTSQLRACQSVNPDRRELEYLRNENFRLAETNRQLQLRIDELEGRGIEEYFCSASCVSYSGAIDNRFLMTATAYTELEADLLAKQEVQKKYSCNYGVKTYKCESIRTDIRKNFCTAACASYSGAADERYMVGARGRNVVEAEVLAVKAVQSKYSCNNGIKIINCN